MDAPSLEQYLHGNIPISRALGVHAMEAGPERVRLSAPLEPNLNHRSTAFGGSVAAVAVLAGWGLLRVRMDDVRPVPHLVIQRNTLEYLLPIAADFEATCPAPPPDRWERFRRALTRRGRGRIDLWVEVTSHGELAARFHGVYVVLDPRPHP